jgi:hypothetical protein
MAQHCYAHDCRSVQILIEFTCMPAGEEVITTHVEILPGSLIEYLPPFLWRQLPNWSRLMDRSFCNYHDFVPFHATIRP